jgi:hypothetical protein
MISHLTLFFFQLKLKSFLFYKRLQLYLFNFNKFKLNKRGKSITKGSIVYMVDGLVHHGGLADRLKGIISLYALAKYLEIDFFIYFKHPFSLNHFLKENNVHWEIDIDYIQSFKNPVTIRTSYRGNLKKVDRLRNNLIYNFGGGYLEEFNNRYNTNYNFKSLFNELFVETEYLKSLLKENSTPDNFIGISFRFQNLFGDFYEGEKISKKILFTYERELLINKCIDSISVIKQNHPQFNLLVTSDSNYFENIVSKIPFIFINKGKVLHIDHNENNDIKNFEKSFVDLLTLSKANEVIRVSGLGIYESGFPYLAALIGDKNFTCIELI